MATLNKIMYGQYSTTHTPTPSYQCKGSFVPVVLMNYNGNENMIKTAKI